MRAMILMLQKASSFIIIILNSACNNSEQCSQTSIRCEGGYYFAEIELENTDLRPPFQTGQESDAPNGAYIWVPNHPTVIRFNVPAEETYHIWGRVLCYFGGEDSFNLQVDDLPAGNWNNIKHGDDWTWDRVSGKSLHMGRGRIR